MTQLSTVSSASLKRPGITPGPGKTATWWRDVWQRFAAQKMAVGAAIVLLLLIATALLAPLLAPYDPTQQFRDQGLEPTAPSRRFPLGTDGLSRDLLSRVLYGGRISLGVGVAANALAVSLALLVGGVAGFVGGKIDFAVMRFVDLVMSMPTFFLILLLVVLLGPSAWVVITVIALFSWPGPARIFRSQILAVKQLDFVQAAYCLGVPRRRIFLRHLVPHVLPLVIVYLALGIPNTIFTEASLGFLGLGIPPPAPSWGKMIEEGRQYYRAAPWVVFVPGLAIMLTVVTFNLVGTALREAMDPTRRGR
ncbi:MAG: ABC transporter permease [Chloroflexota bacterium]|nr:ABC transporter permease [Chloroflexota bacterium]